MKEQKKSVIHTKKGKKKAKGKKWGSHLSDGNMTIDHSVMIAPLASPRAMCRRTMILSVHAPTHHQHCFSLDSIIPNYLID